MRLLILTFYYPPDLSAGSFRASALVKALVRRGGPEIQIDVLTAQPHRYASYRQRLDGEAAQLDIQRSVSVKRLPVGQHQSGLVDQSLVFSQFARRALSEVRGRRYDVVVATSSRLFTGFLGRLIARRTGAALYLDVRDLFLDNVREMFRKPGMTMLLPMLARIERDTFLGAERINLVSEGFLEYCKRRFPPRPYSFFSNGIDPEFLQHDFRKPSSADGRKVVLYAGNIGLGQGIERVIPEAAKVLGDEWAIRIIGDGGQRAELERRIAAAGARNVTLIPPMSRDRLVQEYRHADYLFLHLNGFASLEKVLPSKLFEYAATGKPILAGVRGFARRFISREVDGAAVFDPGDVRAFIEGIKSLTPEPIDRERFKRKYPRERLMDEMAADILKSASAAQGQDAQVRRRAAG
jgi:glycosyltransferase involved in cell wall biosynthesis